MNALLGSAAYWLLAQRHNWERLGDRFSGRNADLRASELGWLVVMAIGAVLALWWLDRLSRQIEGRSTTPDPRRLFKDLCKAHQLSRSERAVLKRLANATQQEQPVHLFVRSDLFREEALPADANKIASLRERLFA